MLNPYYPLRYDPGGFRVWWRRWHDDSDDGLDDAHLMRLAGRFGSDSRVAGPHAQASPTRPRIPDTPNWTFCARLRHCGCCLHSAPSRRSPRLGLRRGGSADRSAVRARRMEADTQHRVPGCLPAAVALHDCAPRDVERDRCPCPRPRSCRRRRTRGTLPAVAYPVRCHRPRQRCPVSLAGAARVPSPFIASSALSMRLVHTWLSSPG